MIRTYASDLTDAQWAIIEPLLPPPDENKRGRPATYSRREILNAIFYIEKTGCQWRMVPDNFPPWNLVWQHFRIWRDKGIFEDIRLALNKKVREKMGKQPLPSAIIADSQSAKTALKGPTMVGLKGGIKASMEARKSSQRLVPLPRGESVISL
jgi:putative transposase